MGQVIELPALNIPEQEIKVILAGSLFQQGLVSLGKAAEISGYSERAFSELLIKKGISPIQYDDQHLEEDIRNA
jgi:predicted HTH domain antitoxin